MKLSLKHNLKTRRKKSKKKRYIKTRKCRNIVRRNRRHTGGNQTSIDINKKSTGLIQGTEKTQIINTSTQNKVPVDYPSVYQILNFKSCTQDKVHKIIHLNLNSLLHLNNINEIDFISVKDEIPGVEYVEVTVNKSFEFKNLNDIIKKGQRTLIYSFSSEPNDEFIKKYNVYLGDPSHYNKNLSIIHTTVFKTLYIEHSVEYELVLNVYYIGINREDLDVLNPGIPEYPDQGIIKDIIDAKDYDGSNKRGKFNMNHLKKNIKLKYRIKGILRVKDHHWWYNLFLTRPCTEAMMLQYGGTCAVVSILNLIFMTPYIASAASAYLQSFYKGIESEIVPFDKMRDPNKNCETLCRSFIYNILVKKQKLKPSDGNITILLSMRLKGITEKDPPDENHYKKCANYSLEKECQNLKKEDECKEVDNLSGETDYFSKKADYFSKKAHNLSEKVIEDCRNSKMGYTYGEGLSAVKTLRCLLPYILDINDFWYNHEINADTDRKIMIYDENYKKIHALRENPKLDGFVLTSCSILIYSEGEDDYHTSFGFICNDIYYIVDNGDVFELDWSKSKKDENWDNYVSYKGNMRFEIQIYVYQKL